MTNDAQSTSNDNDLEEDNSPCIETEEEASEESPKVSLKDKILSMFNAFSTVFFLAILLFFPFLIWNEFHNVLYLTMQYITYFFQNLCTYMFILP